MSAWSDWKCGALSDEDYTAECNREAAMDKAYFDKIERECYKEDEIDGDE